jgi:hypothetical protein
MAGHGVMDGGYVSISIYTVKKKDYGPLASRHTRPPDGQEVPELAESIRELRVQMIGPVRLEILSVIKNHSQFKCSAITCEHFRALNGPSPISRQRLNSSTSVVPRESRDPIPTFSSVRGSAAQDPRNHLA